MSFSALVRSRLESLGYGQKDLARAASVTDSYVSQLLTRRRPPPAPSRTDIYGKMEAFLDLKAGELGRLAEAERRDAIRERLGESPEALFHGFRNLLLDKCVPAKREQVRAVFRRQPFGLLEQIVARTMLETVQKIARKQLDSKDWISQAARVGGRGRREMRVIVLDFLDTDVLDVSKNNCVDFLDPLVESWDVNLATIEIEIRLNGDLVDQPRRRFVLAEAAEPGPDREDPGLEEFLRDTKLSGGASKEEISALRRHSLPGKKPTKLYYYRALQAMRDPLHFTD